MYIFNWIYETFSHIIRGSPTEGLDDSCSLFSIRYDYLYDMVRSVIFSAILWYFSDYKEKVRVPLRFMRNLQDFTKDPKCDHFFQVYLKSQGHNELVEEVQRLKLDISASSVDLSMVQVSDTLEANFTQYKQTRSFRTLEQEIIIIGEVEALGFTKFR